MKFDNETIKTAVKEWLDDSKKAEEKYGHISNWDVSRVTDMNAMFKSAEKTLIGANININGKSNFLLLRFMISPCS